MLQLQTKKKEFSISKSLQLKKEKGYNESMSFIYEDLALPLKEEFPSDLPPSMSDEEIEELKKQYRENNRSKRERKPEVERIDTEDIIDEI